MFKHTKMKVARKFLLFCLLFLVADSFSSGGQAMAQPGVSVSIQAFYNDLAPYGRWIDYRGYGRVWIPTVEVGFQPYGTRGHWIMTEYGNTWVSDYDWGWAPFHYGRWIYDDYYGWIWVPDTEWGPAWVSWRSGGGYYGWAPLGPGVDINININIPLTRWIFVPERYITSPSVYSYCVSHRRSLNVYQSTSIINNIYINNNRRYFYGPRTQDIERVTRSRVVVHHVDNMDRPGRSYASNGSFRVYRPEVSSGRREARPSRGYTNSSGYESRMTPRTNSGTSHSDFQRPSGNDRDHRNNPFGNTDRGNRPGNQNFPDRQENADNRYDQRNRWTQREASPDRSPATDNNWRQRQEQRSQWNRERSEDMNRQRESSIRRDDQRQSWNSNEQRSQRSAPSSSPRPSGDNSRPSRPVRGSR